MLDINNVIIQWGYSWNPTFPIAFTHVVRVVGNSNAWAYCIAISGLSNTNVSFHQWQSANGGNRSAAVYWIAVGY